MGRIFNHLTAAGIAASIAAAGLLSFSQPSSAGAAVSLPVAKVDQARSNRREVAVLAGGCFWGLEAVFEQLKGVESVVSGYAGGTRETATYAQVTTETTRHAEAIRIVYNPAVISYGTLLRIYFSVAHDPTELNRQGPDVGPSYRSAVFAQSAEQGRIARAYVAQLSAARSFAKPIVTRFEGGAFFPAEDYHQDFARKNPRHGYIVRFDAPKVKALRTSFPGLVR
jgi:peptide-methionine (S)-S-oxide reductase